MRELMLNIKKWHFWVLCPVVVLMAAISWIMGVGAIQQQVDKSRNEIDGLYNTLNGIRSISLHPNGSVAAGMDEVIAQRRQEVAKAWTEKYLQQTAEGTGILSWPKDLDPTLLSKVKGLHPIEQMVDFPIRSDQRLALNLRQTYTERLVTEIAKLAEKIGAKWYLEDQNSPDTTFGDGRSTRRNRPSTLEMRGPTGSNLGGEALSEQTKVEWTAQSQQQIMAEHFPWGQPGISNMPSGERFGVATAQEPYPNLLEILYAQEDLWVLQAIMDVIAKTNEGSTARFDAVVKEIDFIRMGKAAVGSAGRVDRLQASAANGDGGVPFDGGGMEGGFQSDAYVTGRPDGQSQVPMDGMPGEDGLGGEGGMMGGGPPDPAEGRYVDEQYQPLSAEKLRQVMAEPESVDPSEAYLAVAKRIPVRLRVKIDQTKLDRFLVELANSPLTIEVRQLRVNPSETGSDSGVEFYGPQVGDGPSRRPNQSITMQWSPPGTSNLGPGAVDDQSTTDITVEVYGIVFIYNPVDEKLLGGAADESQLAEAM